MRSIRSILAGLVVLLSLGAGCTTVQERAEADGASGEPDAALEMQVKKALAGEHTDADRIAIIVSDGEVHLFGRLDARAAKARAEVLARSVPGVRAVANHILLPLSEPPDELLDRDPQRAQLDLYFTEQP